MLCNRLRIALANWLTGDRVAWGPLGKVVRSPYYELCARLDSITDYDLPESRRINGNMWKRLWMERTLEVQKMHKALTRKNRQIAWLKEQLAK